MTVSSHTATASIEGTNIPLISASLTMNDTLNPYIQGTFTTPYNADTFALLDPRRTSAQYAYGHPTVNITFTQSFGLSDLISSQTAIYTGGKISDITADWGGHPISSWSNDFYHPYNASGPIGITEKTFVLTIRSREVDFDANTVTVSVASWEALLFDYAAINGQAEVISPIPIHDLVNKFLGVMFMRLYSGTSSITSGAVWLPGQSINDVLEPILQKASLRLFCTEDGLWILEDRQNGQPRQQVKQTVKFYDTTNIITIDESIDRNQEDWANAVVVLYKWTDSAGLQQYAYDYAANSAKNVKVLFQEYDDTQFPGAGAAQGILDRITKRSKGKTIVAVSDYNRTTAERVETTVNGNVTQNLQIQGITWDFPSNEMTVETRETLIIPV